MKTIMKAMSGAAVLALALGSQSAWANTDTGNLTVTASITAACVINDPTLAFGAYNGVTQVAKDGQTNVLVTCTNTTPYEIYSTTPLADRKMTTGTATAEETLTYKLYADAGRTNELGITAAGNTIADVGDGTEQTQVLYGTIDADQASVPGSYEQTGVNLTVEF